MTCVALSKVVVEALNWAEDPTKAITPPEVKFVPVMTKFDCHLHHFLLVTSTLVIVGVGSNVRKSVAPLPSKNPVVELNLHWPVVEPRWAVVPEATLVPSVPVSTIFSNLKSAMSLAFVFKSPWF